jgi:hypothetical protein
MKLGERRLDLVLLLALLVIATLRSLVWISAYPVFKIIDEPSHFDNIQYRAEHGQRRPVQGERPIDPIINHGASVELRRVWTATNHYWRDSFVRGRRWVLEERELNERALSRSEAVTDGQSPSLKEPGLYHALATIPYRIFRRSSVLARIYAVRVYSMLWGLLFVASTFMVVRWSVDNRALAFAAGLFAILQPMAAQQSVAVHSEAGSIGILALLFALQMAILRRLPALPSMRLCLGLGAVTAISLATRSDAHALLPGTVLVLGLVIVGAPRDKTTWKHVAATVIACLILRVAFALLFNRPGASAAAELRPPPETSLLDFLSFPFGLDDAYFDYLFTSGWGTFCWLDIGLPHTWFDALRSAAPLFWLGLGAAAARRLLAPEQRFFWNPRLVVFSGFTAAVAFVALLHDEYVARLSHGVFHGVQGSALLYALPAGAVLGATSIGSLVPTRFRSLAAALCVVSMILLAAGALLSVIGYEYVA